MKNTRLRFCLFLFFACSDAQMPSTILPSKKVRFQVNYNLHRATLGFRGGYKVFRSEGLRGVVVTNTGDENFKAFDLACPHLRFETCKQGLTTDDFPFLKCSCGDENIAYHIDIPYQTVGKTTYYLREYRVIFEVGILTVLSF